MKMIKTILLLLTLLAGIIASAQTNVSGIIATDVTWTKSNSPYHVTGHIGVLAKLTIDAGVVVNIDSGLKIRIASPGSFAINGTITDTVVFKPFTNGTQWNQIFLDNLTSMVNVNYARIEGASKGVNIVNTNANIKHTQIRNCVHGIYADGLHNYSTLDSCLITQNTYGIFEVTYGGGSFPMRVINSTISHNSNSGIYTLFADMLIDNCVITDNLIYGAFTDGVSQGSTIQNSRFENNDVGIYTQHIEQKILHNQFDNNRIGIEVGPEPLWVVIHCNSFYKNKAYSLVYQGGNGDGGVDAASNYFGTADLDSIHASIYDIYDDITLHGYFSFHPFLTSNTGNCAAITSSVSNIADSEPVLILYPNPANDKLFIETNGTEIEQVNIYNSAGSLVMNVLPSTSICQLSTGSLPTGLYIAEIKTKEGMARKRWVKM